MDVFLNMDAKASDIFVKSNVNNFKESNIKENRHKESQESNFKEAFEKVKESIKEKNEDKTPEKKIKKSKENNKEDKTKINTTNNKEIKKTYNFLEIKEKKNEKTNREKSNIKENNIIEMLNLIKVIDLKINSIDKKELTNKIQTLDFNTNIKKIIQNLEKLKNPNNNPNKINEIIEGIKKELENLKSILNQNSLDLKGKDIKTLLSKFEETLKTIDKDNNFKISLKNFFDKIIATDFSKDSLINNKNKIERTEGKESKDIKNSKETKEINNSNKDEKKIVKEKKVEKKFLDTEKDNNKKNELELKEIKREINEEKIFEIKDKNTIRTKDYKETFDKIMKQMSESAKGFITKDAAHLTINLKPESLGKVKIIINMRENTINGRIIVENEGVKNILSQEIAKVKETLASAGISLDHLDVFSGNENNSKENYNEFLIYKNAAELRKFNSKNQILAKENIEYYTDTKNYLDSNIYIKA